MDRVAALEKIRGARVARGISYEDLCFQLLASAALDQAKDAARK